MFNLRKQSKKGASALPVILLVSGIIMEVVIAGLVVAQLLSNSLLAEQLATEALNVARSGAQDAVNRITSYMDCPDATYCPATYEVSVGSRTACVNISESGGLMTVYSQSSILTREKTVEAIVSVQTDEASVTVQSFKEVESPEDFISC